MKTKLLGLAALLLASAAQGALAQDQGQPGGGNGGDRRGGPHGHGGGGPEAWRPPYPTSRMPNAPPPAPRPPSAPAAPPAGQPPGSWQGGPPSSGGERWRGRDPGDRSRQFQGQPAPRAEGERPRGEPGAGDPRGDWRTPGDRGRPFEGQPGPRPEGQRQRPDARPPGGPGPDRNLHDRGGDRPDGWSGGGDARRDWRDRPDWRGGGDHDRWAPRRYPPSYSSDRHFRAPAWRPPAGYYARTWRYGEYLPRGWFGPDYRLMDWWAFGLPGPPPGCEWIRVGADVLLVDIYTGEILQVVRTVFW